MPGAIKRKLTTILAADVEGYSRLMSADEEVTLNTLKGCREIFDSLISKHDGRVFGSAGDSVLAEFGSTVEAVRCAIAIQEELGSYNTDLPAKNRMNFRIGINVGDVMVEGDNLYGDGVNVAARLEGLAEAGGIFISASAFDQIKGKLSVGFEDIGPQHVKNIDRPVHAYYVRTDAASTAKPATGDTRRQSGATSWPLYAVLGAIAAALLGVVAWAVFTPDGAPSNVTTATDATTTVGPLAESARVAPLSIAVLPFENLSGDPEQDYFADGLTEDLITDLSRIRNAFVIARSTSFTYKNKPVNARDVARELGVRYILEGSARRTGDTVRVNAQLIDGESGSHVWSEKFDRQFTDVIALQSDITGHIAAVLRAELLEAESRRPKPANIEAWDYALQGTVKIHRPSLGPQVYTEAKGLFEKALELDPNLALAWEGLSFIYFVASTRELPGISGPETSKLALEAAEKSVVLDPLSSNAHVVLGLAARWNGHDERAVSACEKALELNPNNDEAYLCASRAYYVLGRLEESIRMVEIAERLNPRFRPWRRDFYTGASRYFMGEYEAAVTDLQRAKADFPGHQSLTFHLVAALAMAGRDAEANAMLDDYYQLAGSKRDSIAEIRESHQNGTPDFEMLAEGLRRAGMPEQ